MKFRYSTIKKIAVISAALAIPSFWNACGKVAFDADQSSKVGGTGNPIYCGAAGADPANCLPPPRAVSQNIDVKVNADVDILFVVDNSGSMAQEQADIGNKIGGFLDKIKDLNWQIAITTTDAAVNTKGADGTLRAWGDGQFRPFDGDAGSNFILKPNSAPLAADLQNMLGTAMNVGILGGGNERGINATYRAVERSAAASVNKDFIRPDARLAVVVISDEDECSKGYGECPAASVDKSRPEKMAQVVKDILGMNKVFSFNSIIKIPGDATCTTADVEGALYNELTTLTGGVKGSVCSADFSAPLADLGKKVTELIKSVNLSCVPVDYNGDGKPDLSVKLSTGATLTSGFTISGTSVTFDNAMPGGTHKFDYYCN